MKLTHENSKLELLMTDQSKELKKSLSKLHHLEDELIHEKRLVSKFKHSKQQFELDLKKEQEIQLVFY